eukprot:515656-Pleurochrysis_carterae.AAC.1
MSASHLESGKTRCFFSEPAVLCVDFACRRRGAARGTFSEVERPDRSGEPGSRLNVEVSHAWLCIRIWRSAAR